MAIITLKDFTGMTPRTPVHLLPDNAAQDASECDFAYGELKGIKSNEVAVTLAATPSAFFTHDGDHFYYWTGGDVDTALSPFVADMHQRLYYTGYCGPADELDFRVVSMVDNPPLTSGGKPSGYKVGVPGPSSAVYQGYSELHAGVTNYDTSPESIATAQTASGQVWYPAIKGLVMVVKAFYEVNGTRSQEQDCSSFFDDQIGDFPASGAYTVLTQSAKYAGNYNAILASTITGSPRTMYTIVDPGETDFVTRFGATANQKGIMFWANVSGIGLTGGGTVVPNERILGRDFHVKLAPDATASDATAGTLDQAAIQAAYAVYTTVVEWGAGRQAWLGKDPKDLDLALRLAYGKDPVGRVIQVTGLVDGVELFNVYSDGSSFTSTPGAVAAKLIVTPSASDPLIFYCGLKYGSKETHAYTYTNVNTFDEESAPANPVLVDIGYGQSVELYLNFRRLLDNTYAPTKSLRFYGTNTSSQGVTDYYFISEETATRTGGATLFTASTTTDIRCQYPVVKLPGEWGEPLSTTYATLPPAGAIGLCAMPNGMLACHRDTSGGGVTGPGMNEVWFCEPYQPSAWPAKYAVTLPYDVVSITPQGTGLVVATRGRPYYLYGAHPESITQMELKSTQAGVAKRAVVDAGTFVVYASHDGLVAVNNTDVNLDMSIKFFTRETWRKLYGANLSNLVLAFHGGVLIGYFTNGSAGFKIRTDEAAGALTKSVGGAVAHAVTVTDDQLLFCVGTPTLQKYASSSVQEAYTWRSKEFVMLKPLSMAVGMIILDDANERGDVIIDIYADDPATPYYTNIISASGYFRILSGKLATRWSIKFSAGRTIKQFFLATSVEELKDV